MTAYHLAIGFAGPVVEAERIQGVFPAGCGWVRYSPNCWIISTVESAVQIVARVRTLISAADSIFVVEVNLSNNNGYLQPEVWQYINAFATATAPPPPPSPLHNALLSHFPRPHS